MDTPVASLIDAGAQLTAQQLTQGTTGNLSVKLQDRMLITASGAPLAQLEPGDISVMSLQGEHLEGPKPSKEFPLHLAMYDRDPEVSAIVHVHSTYASAHSCLEPWSATSALPPLTPYLVMRVGQVPLIPYATPGDAHQADAIRNLAVECNSILLANHGAVTSGPTLSVAIDRAVEIEACARLLSAIGARQPRLLTDDEVRALVAAYGQPWSL